MSFNKVLIYSVQSSSRLQYTLGVIFGSILGKDFELTSSTARFLACAGPKINYSREGLNVKALQLCPHNILFETFIRKIDLKVRNSHDFPTFFHVSEAQSAFPFDPFAMIFFMVSRYEEYNIATKDRHLRFPAQQSIASKHQFLKLPLANILADSIEDQLIALWPDYPPSERKFQFIPTYDIDMAYAFKYKSWWQYPFGFLKDILRFHPQQLKLRSKVLAGQLPDPFDTFAMLEQWHKNYQLQPKYFFLLATAFDKYDQNNPVQHPKMHQLITQIAQEYEVGIHPSYRSNHNPQLIQVEKKVLENIVGKPIVNGRQHFLKLEFPSTYQHYLNNGIQADYTMGYASQIGFRAGIANAYPWYDLSNECETKLMIHPFQIMDGTLKQYLKLSPEEALQEIEQLIQITRIHRGTFISLWHNSSFSKIGNWEPWKDVYHQLLQLATATND